ncbi:uncharacterized protein RAG0_01784 [Rhynchosporium agropyri]|uniref:HTH psq-type domain-containing protein n=1 Tax=Rhynchosporium agropyri TaxID=914238 RepID=A0A1E1JYI4_9HELO|nr:uncharacterized protein RAG0_01784 [Rhynchosporium agropyri]
MSPGIYSGIVGSHPYQVDQIDTSGIQGDARQSVSQSVSALPCFAMPSLPCLALPCLNISGRSSDVSHGVHADRPTPYKYCTVQYFSLDYVITPDLPVAGIREARKWALDNPSELPRNAARIFDVKEDTLRQLIHRAKLKVAQSSIRLPKGRGSQNKILTPIQEEAIVQYYYDQWELKKTPYLYTIKTKPIEAIRLETHIEEEVRAWFQELGDEIARLQIDSRKKVLNMDESGIRVGCPSAEKVIVPVAIIQLYIPTQGSRKTVTVIETIRGDGKKTLPPFVICPGEHIILS